jgi:hypothetical protein
VKAYHYNGMHPSLEDGAHVTIYWMMTCAPRTVQEYLKILINVGLTKTCLPGNVPREYEALQFCLAPGEPGTQGHYL